MRIIKFTLLMLIIFSKVSHCQYYSLLGKPLNNNSGLNTYQGSTIAMSNGATCVATLANRHISNNSYLIAEVFTLNGTNYSVFNQNIGGTQSITGNATTSMIDISSDCKTLVIASSNDDCDDNETMYIYTFNGVNFQEIGNPITIGTNTTTSGCTNSSIAISGDGQTIVVGNWREGESIDFDLGAVWVYSFDGSNFQQAQKIYPTQGIGNYVLFSDIGLDISSDGQTIYVGGPGDNNDLGAVWAYRKTGGLFSQIGSKIVPTDNVSTTVGFGVSLNCTSDGNMVVVGSVKEDNNMGAARVYSFNGNNFIQLGNKLVGTGNVGHSYQGIVAISGNGSIIASGGINDNPGINNGPDYGYFGIGAVWIFTFNGSSFNQAGNKIVPESANTLDTVEFSYQQIALSSDGKYLAVGGLVGNPTVVGINTLYYGSVWVFTATSGITTQNNPNSGGNGTTTITSINTLTGITDFNNSDSKGFKVYPNPSSGTFIIEFTRFLEDEHLQVQVYSTFGQHIATLEAGEASLPKGLYLLRYSRQFRKMIVE